MQFTDPRTIWAASQGKLNIKYLDEDSEMPVWMSDVDQRDVYGADKSTLHDRKLLNFSDAAMLLSMSEQALRDLVHKGKGPETVRRGKRVCFTHEGLDKYVSSLPKELPYQGISEALNGRRKRSLSVEERAVFG